MAGTLTGSAPVDVLVAATHPGWPRRRFAREGERGRPLPWVNALNPAIKPRGWVEMHGERVRRAEESRLCFCCGIELRRLSLMGRHRASFEDGGVRVWLTDGPAGHPRCMALAAAHCPHLLDQHEGRRDYVIALAWDRPTLGYVETPADISTAAGGPRFVVRPGARPVTLGELRALAARDPLGELADNSVTMQGVSRAEEELMETEQVQIADPPSWLRVESDGSIEIDFADVSEAVAERRVVVGQLWRDGWRPLIWPELSDVGASRLGPFARDSETSRKAALDAYPRQGSQRVRILNALDMEAATREELGERLNIPDNSIRPRVKELIEGGWVEETDHTRPTQTGSEAAILKLTNRACDERAIRRQREA